METSSKVKNYGHAFVAMSAGLLMMGLTGVAVYGMKVQRATAFNLMADAHRQLSLAKTYDAKAAALAINTVANEIL